MNAETFDLVVIGAGPAGEKGAITAAFFGKRVALVEKQALVGGAVANTGTMPSKMLRESALALMGIKGRELRGVHVELRSDATITDLMHHRSRIAAIQRERSLSYLSEVGVTLAHGHASFVDPQVIRVRSNSGDRFLRAHRVLIATGSSAFRPPVFPVDDPRICDPNEILSLTRLPRRLIIVGAGVIASESACTFAALGSKVTVCEKDDAFLPFLDREISTSLLESMKRLEVQFHWSEQVVGCDVAGPDASVGVTLASGRKIEGDAVLVAVGRTSNTADLGLDVIGIPVGAHGVISVDEHGRTAAPHVYAAGDVVGSPALVSAAIEQARVAVAHAFELKVRVSKSPVVPTGIYTIPEVSFAGETEESLRAKGIDYVVGKAAYRDSVRGQLLGEREGFLKLLFRRNDLKLLGVHVIGEQAAELVHTGLLALLEGADWQYFNQVCFNFPTLAWLYQRATYDAAAKSRTSSH